MQKWTPSAEHCMLAENDLFACENKVLKTKIMKGTKPRAYRSPWFQGHQSRFISLNMSEAQGGGVLLYFHTYVGSGHFLGFKILNFNIFGGFQKNKYFLGYEDLVDIFGGHHRIGLYSEVIYVQYKVFF